MEGKKPSKKVSDNGIKTKHAEFETLALKPHGITIEDDRKHVNPFQHFATDPAPTTGVISHYKSKNGLQDTSLWLEGDDQFTEDILREYKSMKEFKLCESEYSLYAFENLLKREMRSPHLPNTTSWLTERMVEFTTRPGDHHWETPPVIHEKVARKDYAFDVRPDCSYWITLQAFHPKYRKRIEEHVLVRHGRILWPYFIIEFKKDSESNRNGTTFKTARNQIAAASAIGLYNRWKLKKRALDATGQQWGPKTAQMLRHYGITFVGCNYDIWCIEADVGSSGTWTGCRMFRLYEDKCSTAEGVHGFINWVNEIHSWGLTVYGPDCEKDVKDCIDSASEAG
ncbi:uncharacterized protein K452DRAFT_220771 [Aplosporella prunicola CBS 121167]|uniref:Uncharacterized protein n=1 Tax=Aplosporella prunicola CBS 121167 TaxID=1176127 RepID=A0A6A6BRB2_9PEZI|nr:uncharacterized protein K452DRAFT_220771 [Aplosporella prunicola CBS 121167]KAF2145845.1 hypothetical protein K452DRAFT_220771 [Aplosporella prunicola CBS 121167]